MLRKTKLFLLLLTITFIVGSMIPDFTVIANEEEHTRDTGNEAREGQMEGDPVEETTMIQDDELLQNMQLVQESDRLELYFDPQTTEIAIREKKNGYVWFSNPIDRERDEVAAGENVDLLNSLLFFEHYNPVGGTTRMNSYRDSVAKEQFEYEITENGVRIVFEFGDTSLGIHRIPKRISKERFETLILDKIEDEKTREDLKKRFVYIEEEGLYERRDASFPKVILERTSKLLDEIGYTLDELAKDNAEHGVSETEQEEKPSFTIPVRFAIDGDQFVATIEGEEIQFSERYPIATIYLLPYFGAANHKAEGYMFVPDGSGALIYLNNEKTIYEPFEAPVYGRDGAVFRRELTLVSEDIRLPVFGLKNGDHAFLAIIEQGDSIASIHADVAGRINNYNYVFSSFKIKESTEITLSGGERSSTMTVVQSGNYKNDISVRYSFLANDDANYVGMAHHFRDYLVERFGMERLNGEEKLPFFLELTGSIWKRKTFLGIPYKSLVSLTTFEEAEKIVQRLLDEDINNIKLRYTGWFNGGIHHKVPTTITVDKVLGGKKRFKELVEYLEREGVKLYPDVALTRVYDQSWRFIPARDASRYINKKIAEIYPYNPATNRRDRENRRASYIVSPAKLPKYVQAFIEEYKDFDLSALALRDLGAELNSDFREKKVVTREDSKNIAREQYETLASEFSDLLTIGGNAYAIPYSQAIIDIPMTSSSFNIADESVPFYQIVLHGYVDYAGKPINLSPEQNVKKALLQCLETGANVYFQWFYADPDTVKETEFNYMYSSHYQIWFDEAIELYKEVNRILGEVRNQLIVNHEKIEDGVYETTYENGLSIVVNYTKNSVVVDGEIVQAESYMIRQGE